MTGRLAVLLLSVVVIAVAVPTRAFDADHAPTLQLPDDVARNDAVATNDKADPGKLPQDAVAWYAQAAVPLYERYRGMSCVESWPDSSFLYAVAGQDGSVRYSDGKRFDVRTNTWQAIASLPEPNSGQCAVWWTDNGGGTDSSGIYVLGRYDGPYYATCYHWTKATDTWSSTDVPAYPGTPYSGNMAAVVGDSIFLMHRNGSPVELHRYSIREGTWTARPAPPGQNFYGAMCAYNGKVWQMGGWSAVLDLQVYDPRTGIWTTLPAYTGFAGGNSPAMAGITGRIYVWGGGDEWTDWSGVAYYDIAAGAWTTETSMPTGIVGAFAGILDSAGTYGMHRAAGQDAMVAQTVHYRGVMGLPPPPTVTVTAPNGGEVWGIGGTATITCTHVGWADTDSICLSLDGGATWSFLLKEAGAATHTVPLVPNSPTTQARIQITAISAVGSNVDAGDADFTIEFMPPTVTVTAPNGGETWGIGRTATVTCTHGGGGPVTDSICLSTDGGATYSFLFKEAAAAAHTVPSVPDSPTTQARIQITAINATGSNADASDADFSIIPVPEVPALVSPTNGATSVALIGNLVWDAAANATAYDVYLDVVTPPVILLAGNVVGTSQLYSGLANGRTYYWQVTAKNLGGSTPSVIWSFTTVGGAPTPGGWHPMTPVIGATLVKDGGAMAYNADEGLVYEMKGNKTLGFNCYNPAESTWTALAPVPIGLKPVKGGASMATGAGKVFVTKGNNTLEFYRYDIAAGAWLPVTRTVPLGAGKKVKAGGSMAFVPKTEGDFVYLLKGYGTEFYRYDVLHDSFTMLASAPNGAKAKYDKGSWIVYDGARYLYVYKSKYGPNYSEFYKYDVLAEAWSTSTLSVIPLVDPLLGKRKKVGDGSAAAFGNGALYAFKGNNNNTLWKYTPMDSSWAELETIPQVAQTGDRKKKVKAGAALVYYPGTNVFYAQKGNKCNQFWLYKPGTGLVDEARPNRDGAMASGRLAIDDWRLTIAPNPMVGSRVLHLTTGAPGHSATIAIYDALGRLVLARSLGHSTTNLLDVRDLSAGIYIVKLSSDDFSTSQKLVVER